MVTGEKYRFIPGVFLCGVSGASWVVLEVQRILGQRERERVEERQILGALLPPFLWKRVFVLEKLSLDIKALPPNQSRYLILKRQSSRTPDLSTTTSFTPPIPNPLIADESYCCRIPRPIQRITSPTQADFPPRGENNLKGSSSPFGFWTFPPLCPYACCFLC